MKSMRRRILCMGVVALLLLGLVGCGIAVPQQAHREEAGDNAGKGLALGKVVNEVLPRADLNAPIGVVHRGFGFAMEDDEFHVLRIHIVRVRHLQPVDIKGLLEANKSIKEIRAELMEREGLTSYQGQMRLGNNSYKLVNISVTEDGDYPSFSANLTGPVEESELSESGSISVTIKEYEGVRIGEGTLTMNDGVYSGTYRVLLQVSPPVPRSWGQQK